jgi:hypothetical protein
VDVLAKEALLEPTGKIGLGTWQFGSREWGYGDRYAHGESARIVERFGLTSAPRLSRTHDRIPVNAMVADRCLVGRGGGANPRAHVHYARLPPPWSDSQASVSRHRRTGRARDVDTRRKRERVHERAAPRFEMPSVRKMIGGNRDEEARL